MAKLSAQSLLALREDVVELRELLKEATRPNVQRHLSNRIVELENQLREATCAERSGRDVDGSGDVPLEKHSWDQNSTVVK